MAKFIYHNVKDFNTDHIFDCGQCFRWTRESDGSYTGIAFGKIGNMRYEGNTCGAESSCTGEKEGSLIIDNCGADDFRNIWKNYLDLDRDYSLIKEELSASDEIMRKAIMGGGGIRILRQELWETMISFIISQNNNIPRIKGCIENLCRLFGEKAGEYKGKEYYNIPTPEKLAEMKPDELAECRLGYRAPYLTETAAEVVRRGGMRAVEHDLAELEKPEQVIEYLRGFKGVGPKVANCIALFGLSRFDAFPIDVWVKRVMNRLYNIDEKDTKNMAKYAEEHFGENGGIAQQYLFYYIRGLEEL